MPEVEYVYSKPKKSFPKKILLIPILVTAIAAFLMLQPTSNTNSLGNSTQGSIILGKGNETFTISSVPSGYSGVSGLEYIRNNSQAALSKARSLCADQFKGMWIDNQNTMGCFDMQGFSTLFCVASEISDLERLCDQISGTHQCSTNQVSCSVNS